MASQTGHVPEGSQPKTQRITQQVLLAGGQLLVAGGAAIMWEYIANVFGSGESRQYPLAPVGSQIVDACMIAILGFLLALLVVRLLPDAASAGRWVWLPPTFLVGLLIGLDILRYGWDWHSISAHYFWAYPAQYIGPIERDILTYPALSAVTYSPDTSRETPLTESTWLVCPHVAEWRAWRRQNEPSGVTQPSAL